MISYLNKEPINLNDLVVYDASHIKQIRLCNFYFVCHLFQLFLNSFQYNITVT